MALLWRMKKSRQWAFLGGVLILMQGVVTAVPGGDYECKPSPWIYGSKATIVFRLDKNKYDTNCTGRSNGMPVFQSSPDGKGTYIQNCTVATDIRKNCSFPAGALGCGCVNSNDNGSYLIEYNFIAAPDYDRWWKADINCFGDNVAAIFDFSGINCNNILVATTTSPPPPTTTTTVTTTSPPPPPTTTTVPPPPGPCRFCECRKECFLCCFLCILLIILCIILGGFIIAVIILYCFFRDRVTACAAKPGCKHSFCRGLVALFGCMDSCMCCKGSTSSPETRNAGNNDKETNIPMTASSKPGGDDKDEEDGGPSPGNRESEKPVETRQKKKKNKKQMEEEAAEKRGTSAVSVTMTSSPEPAPLMQASSGRQLPQPHKAGAPETSTWREAAGKREETTSDQKPSPIKGSRPLPLPFEAQGNGTGTTTTTTTATPRSLAPLRNPPPSYMPSVERNSYAEVRGGSPPRE